jgi:hypothetical protein
MAPTYSKLNDTSQVADRLNHHLVSDPPPIKFMRSDRASKPVADTMYHEFEYRLDNLDENSTKMSKKTLMFENGDAEMWCDWRIEFEDLIRLAPLTTAEHKSNAALTLFKGKALQHFKEYTRTVEIFDAERVKKKKTKWTDEQKFYEILDRVAQEFIPVKHAYRRQCFYMRYHLYIGGKFGVREFMARLHRINACIPYFPRKADTQGKLDCRRLPDDELCAILNLAKKPEWSIKMLEADKDPYDYDLHGLSDYLERLETAHNISAKRSVTNHDEMSKNNDKSRKRKNGNGEARSASRGDPSNNPPFKKQKRTERTQCPICKKYHKGECRFKNSTAETAVRSNTKINGTKFTDQQYSHLMMTMMANAKAFKPSKKTKRRVQIKDSSDEEENQFAATNLNDSSSDDEEVRTNMRASISDMLGDMTFQSKKND